MPQSARFQSMMAAMDKLRRQFLPAEFDATGSYEPDIIAHARAYRVLAHAEAEHFVEDRAKELALASLSKWRSEGVATRTLVSLVTFSGVLMESPPDVLQPLQANQAQKHAERLYLKERIDWAAKIFMAKVAENHGVKEKNLLDLLLPVGINPHDLDPVWLTTMNSFGEKRGEAAHLSADSTSVQHPPDPRSELELVVSVIAGLEGIDAKLTELLPAI